MRDLVRDRPRRGGEGQSPRGRCGTLCVVREPRLARGSSHCLVPPTAPRGVIGYGSAPADHAPDRDEEPLLLAGCAFQVSERCRAGSGRGVFGQTRGIDPHTVPDESGGGAQLALVLGILRITAPVETHHGAYNSVLEVEAEKFPAGRLTAEHEAVPFRREPDVLDGVLVLIG